MTIRTRWLAVLVAFLSLLSAVSVPAQTSSPEIRSFTVDQVQQLTPGTELVFRANGTPGGALSVRVDGIRNPIDLVETRPGVYEGAHTLSLRDNIKSAARVDATLKSGDRQTTVSLGQSLLTGEAHARANAVANPNPQITRIETRNSGGFSAGHDVGFVVTGTPGGKASVAMNGGKTNVALVEEKSGQYSGNYTVKSRDQLSEASRVNATLAFGDRKTTASKTLGVGALVVSATPVGAKCDGCGVVQSVNRVKVKGKPDYLGAIAGGVAGAALGSQVGKGDGKTAATVAGALGGAVAGREIEKRVRSKTRYDVLVRLNNGSTETVSFETEPAFKAGDKVRRSGDTLVLNP